MGTTAEKLAYLNITKNDIKDAIISKGVDVTEEDTFRDYADRIRQIDGGAGEDYLAQRIQNQLITYTVPNGITKIADYSFADCGNLESIVLPNSLVSIGSNAFSNVSKINNIDFKNVKYIASGQFSLKSGIKLTENVVQLGNNNNTAFGSSTTYLTLYNGVYYLGTNTNDYYCAYYCDNSKIPTDGAITLHDDCKLVGSGCFYNKSNLKSLDLNNVEYISNYAITNCSNLESLTANHVNTFGYYLLNSCPKLNFANFNFNNVLNIHGGTTLTIYQYQTGLNEININPNLRIYNTFDNTGETDLYGRLSFTIATGHNFTGKISYEKELKGVLNKPTFNTHATESYLPNLTVTGFSLNQYDKELHTLTIKKLDYENPAFINYHRLRNLIILSDEAPIDTKTAAYNIFDGSCYWMYGTVNATYNPNGEFGSIYVPDALVDTYKAHRGWARFASLIKPLSQWTGSSI